MQRLVQADPRILPAPGQEAPVAQAVTEAEGDLLDEVSVTATRRPTRERDTTATTYSVKKQDFQAQGARTVTDALRLVPGFQGPPALGGAGGAAFFLRGFDDKRFQLLKDGLSLQRSANGRTDISRFIVDNLERVEVVTGGATLRYGSGSIGGVINLITETPQGPPKLTLNYDVGSYGFSQYTAKYGGGDDTFSYNLVYSSIVAFNNYPYSFTLPNQAQFYGPTTNQDAAPPARVARFANYPNSKNSYGVGGLEAGDPDNSGAIDLFGFLKPEVGPPITVTGVNDTASTASDNYAAKLTFKPDPANRIILSSNLQNYKTLLTNPANTYRTVCFGGASVAANPTLALNQFFPVDSQGNPLPCDQQRYLPRTPSSTQALPYNFNTSLDGSVVFPVGQSYPYVENNTADQFYYGRLLQQQIDLGLLWDWEISPTTSLNSYVAFYQFRSPRFTPQPYIYGTNIKTGQNIPGAPGQRTAPLLAQPYSESDKFEIQSALNTQISAGQTLSFGVNFLQDRSYQQPTLQANFFDKAISRSSVFLIDDISFGPDLKANLGFRYTYSTQFGVVGTPAVGVRYSPSKLLSLRANWSQVYNAPYITDLFTNSAGFISNPDLRPETGITYDVGADLTLAPNLGVRLTYFNTSLDGTFTTVALRNPDANTPGSPTAGFNFLFQLQNLGSRRASGIELATDWQVSEQWRFRLVWTNTDARNYGLVDNVNQPTFPYFYGYQDSYIPFNNVTLAASYTNRGITATLLGRYDSGKRRFNALDFAPAFATLDLNVEIPLTPSFTLTGSAANLTDTQYELFPGAPAPGTTFRVGGRLELGGGSSTER